MLVNISKGSFQCTGTLHIWNSVFVAEGAPINNIANMIPVPIEVSPLCFVPPFRLIPVCRRINCCPIKSPVPYGFHIAGQRNEHTHCFIKGLKFNLPYTVRNGHAEQIRLLECSITDLLQTIGKVNFFQLLAIVICLRAYPLQRFRKFHRREVATPKSLLSYFLYPFRQV